MKCSASGLHGHEQPVVDFPSDDITVPDALSRLQIDLTLRQRSDETAVRRIDEPCRAPPVSSSRERPYPNSPNISGRPHHHPPVTRAVRLSQRASLSHHRILGYAMAFQRSVRAESGGPRTAVDGKALRQAIRSGRRFGPTTGTPRQHIGFGFGVDIRNCCGRIIGITEGVSTAPYSRVGRYPPSGSRAEWSHPGCGSARRNPAGLTGGAGLRTRLREIFRRRLIANPVAGQVASASRMARGAKSC